MLPLLSTQPLSTPLSSSHRIEKVVMLTLHASAAQVRSLIVCIAPCRLQAPREILLRHPQKPS